MSSSNLILQQKLIVELMEVENYLDSLRAKLKEKTDDNTTYRKANAVFESVIEASKQIPDFRNKFADKTNTLALYIFGAVYKLLMKALSSSSVDKKYEYNIDSYLLLLNYTINELNPSILQSANLLQGFQSTIYGLLSYKDRTPMVIRLSLSILSHTFMWQIENIDFQQDIAKRDMILGLFQKAVESHRSQILSKETARLLTHLAKNNESVVKVISKEAKKNLLQNLDNRKELYLNNVKDLILEFPIRLINDIAYRVASQLPELDHSSQQNEQYLTQAYFFLEKMMTKLLPSTTEPLLQNLIGNVPVAGQSEKIIFCYLQLLYETTAGLISSSQKIANKYLPSVVGIFQEFLLGDKKVEKQASNLLGFLLINCVKPSLWTSGMSDANDIFKIQSIELQDNEQKSFQRLICMLQSLLSSRFPNTRISATLLTHFFKQLDSEALPECEELIKKCIDYRDQIDHKLFNQLMGGIFNAFGISVILKEYPLKVEGDISKPQFQNNNNLWLLACLQKYEGQESMLVFSQHFLPLLQTLRPLYSIIPQTPRSNAYRMLSECVWRCFKIFCKQIDTNLDYQSILVIVSESIEGMSDGTLEHVCLGLEILCFKLREFEYHSVVAEKIVKSMASMVDISKNNSKQILRAIKSVSLITNQAYLTRVFDKNIIKLIELQEAGKICQEQTKNLKNLEIIISVSFGVSFRDPTVIPPFNISREELVIRLVTGLIGENNIFQKKGYKYIFQCISLMPQSFTLQIIDLIQNNQKKILAASKHYRLTILNKLWKRLIQSQIEQNMQNIFNFIKSYLPQILITLRETNKRARREATNIFNDFTNKIIEWDLLQNFIEIMCAGLAGNRVQIKMATIAGLQMIISNKSISKEGQFFVDVLQIVLMLLKQKKQELYKCVVEYCKKYIFTIEKAKQNLLIPNIINELFVEDEESKLEHRSILKHFLLKLVKKNDRSSIQKLIPLSDRKILSNAIKTENRERRKKRAESIKRRQEYNRRKQQNADSSSDDEKSQVGSHNENKMEEEEQNQELQQLDANKSNNLLLKYDLQHENFHFQKDKFIIEQKSEKKKKDEEGDITFDERGIMIIRQEGKRMRPKDNQMQEEGKDQANPTENYKKKVKIDSIHQIKESGSTFKSDRAGGDVRLRDKPEPYAFIQFNSKALNKRFKKKAEKIFDTIFQKNEGGLKGVKARIANR